MGKSTLVLIALAALGLGTLVGVSLVNDEPAVEEAAPATATDVEVASTGGAPVFRFLSPEGVMVEEDEFGQPLPFTSGENFIARDGVPKTETLTITLDLDATVEYKALMQQGDTISYRWSTDGSDVYYDFHAHDDAFGPEFFTRYAEGEGTVSAGTIMAAYTGQHGWFWLNLGDGPTTITLDVYGFYDEIIEIDLEGY